MLIRLYDTNRSVYADPNLETEGKIEYGEEYRQGKSYLSRTSGSRTKRKVENRQNEMLEMLCCKFFAKLVQLKNQSEAQRSLLSELMESPDGEYIGYWEDSLYCSADAKILFEEYEPMDDKVIFFETMTRMNQRRSTLRSNV